MIVFIKLYFLKKTDPRRKADCIEKKKSKKLSVEDEFKLKRVKSNKLNTVILPDGKWIPGSVFAMETISTSTR